MKELKQTLIEARIVLGEDCEGNDVMLHEDEDIFNAVVRVMEEFTKEAQREAWEDGRYSTLRSDTPNFEFEDFYKQQS